MIRVWYDDPKPGETNAQWCGTRSVEGHIVQATCGHETADAARAVLDRGYKTELTPAGEQLVIPGCERNTTDTTKKQLNLF